MTAQKHIDAIGASIVSLEAKAKALRKAAREIEAAAQALHGLLDAAQQAHIEIYSGADNMIVPFSGGVDKVKPDNPDEPVKP